MIAGIFQYYFMMAEDVSDFVDQMASPLQTAGFKVINRNDENGLPKSMPMEPISWNFPAGADSSVVALAYSPQGTLEESLQEIEALEKQSGLDLDMILGQATIVIGTELTWEELSKQSAAVLGKKTPDEIAVKNGRLMRYGLSPTRAFYLAQPGPYNAKSAVFWGQRLAQIEALQLNTAIVCRLLRDQLTMVRGEGTALERELSLILHANLVSAQGAQKEAQELDAQLNGLTSSYGKIAGSRHLVAQGQARLRNLLNQLTRQLRPDAYLAEGQPLFDGWLASYEERMDELAQAEADLQAAQQDYQAGIEVVRSRIDMMNNRSNLETQAQIRELMEQNTEMQKQSLVFQYAAGLIEFIVLAYYSHSLWKNLAHDGYLMIPASIQFIMVLLFSGNAVYCTHLLAEYMQGEHEVRTKMIAAVTAFIILLAIIIVGTILAGAPGAGAGTATGH